jgi:uncharacterized YccA/Bax inhibitor family protein
LATSNPVFANDTFTQFGHAYGASRSTVMTVQGTVGKTFFLLAILSATAIWSWTATSQDQLQVGVVLPAAGILGFVLALITSFKPTTAPWTAPVYAAFEGVFLGALSCLIEMKLGRKYPGIAIQAVSLTGGTLFCMLFAYTTGLVKVTEKFKAGIIAAIGAILLVKLIGLVMLMFGAGNFLWSSSPIGIVFSIIVVGVAAFSLLLDFDFIEEGARAEAPKFMEWYGAFGLMVTLIWLYLEILRLLQKLQDRR